MYQAEDNTANKDEETGLLSSYLVHFPVPLSNPPRFFVMVEIMYYTSNIICIAAVKCQLLLITIKSSSSNDCWVDYLKAKGTIQFDLVNKLRLQVICKTLMI